VAREQFNETLSSGYRSVFRPAGGLRPATVGFLARPNRYSNTCIDHDTRTNLDAHSGCDDGAGGRGLSGSRARYHAGEQH
jgi:hypothetical protein